MKNYRLILMKSKIYFLLLFVFNLSYSWASHVPGGNITYQNVGNNQFVVTLTMYEDCGTAFESNGPKSITISNDCGATPISVSLPIIVYQQEMSQLCPSALNQSECNGGTYPGVYMHVWQDTITLTGQCDSWTFSYSSCCRAGSTNLVGTSDNYYFYADLNNLNAPSNSSPYIGTSTPIPYSCTSSSFCYDLGVIETDGDSLVFSFVAPATGATSTVSYQAGYSATSPYPGLSIDPGTGQITGVLSQTGNYVIAVLIQEYNSAGVLIGTTVQDFVLEVLSCNNQTVDCSTTGTISNVNGSVTQTGPTTLEMCEGVPFSFDMSFTDPDAGDSLYLSSNIASVLPGAVVTYSYPNSPAANTISMYVSWTPPPGSANSNNFFNVVVRDNSCPVPGQQTIVYNMNVLGSTNAGNDIVLCLGDTAQLDAVNGNTFTWSSISGDPITVGTNFSCNPCSSPLANPSQTTTYVVTSDLTGSCSNTDTVTVNVVPDFNYTLSQSSNTTCLNSAIQLDIQTSPPGNYSYNWTPAANMNNTTISNPTITPTAPGTYNYSVEITSASGCVKYDTVSINVAAAYAPNVTVSLDTNNIVCGDSVHLTVDLGCGVPNVSGPSSGNIACSTPTDTDVNQSQCGANTSTTYPAPYANWYKNAKHQFLFHASELNAAGIQGGQINQIAWQITAINGTTTYNSYTIKIGTTPTTSLSTWETGLTQVFGPTNITIATGWNTHTFSTPYLWDGISNLVVEVCFDNLASSYSSNSITPWECTSFNSSIYYRSDATVACTYTGTPSTSTNRPVTRFNTNLVAPDPSTYTFQWPTGQGIDNPSAQNVAAGPVVTTDYQLVVTNTNGGCTDTVNVQVDVTCGICMSPIPSLTNITCNGGSDGAINAQPVGSDGPPWIMELYDNNFNMIQADSNVVSSANFTGLPAGVYRIRSIDTTGCFADTVITLTEPMPVTLSPTSDTIICIGGSATLYANPSGGNGTPYLISWIGQSGNGNSLSVNPSSTATYSFYATDPMGCKSDTSQITVNIFPPILLNSSILDTVCPGEPSSINVTANGGVGGPYFYDWFDSQGNSVGSSDVLTITPTSSPSIYYVTVTDNCETPPSYDSVRVYWYQEPVVSFYADAVDGCYPVTANFINTTDPSLVSSCDWDFGNGNGSNVCGNVSYIYNQSGVYDVSLAVTSPDGCVVDTTYSSYINVYNYPTANFGSNPNPADVLHPEVQFTDSSSSDVTSYQWYFGENGVLGNSNDPNPSFTFPGDEPNTYPVQLVVSNQYSCIDSITHYLIVNGVFNFYVPNSFTPNGDGINDYFFPLGEGESMDEYHFYIFNRWGEKIFEATQLDTKWDGKYMNQPVEEGIYVWKIQVINAITEEFYEYTGQVTLIR